MKRRITVNGKFLDAGLNGVHRTAAHYASELTRLDRVRIVAPREHEPDPEFPALRPEVVPGHCGSGQGWEMLTLPRVARGDTLINFCNLAPLLHGNSVVMIHDAQTFLHPEDYSGRQAAAYRALLPWIARRARRILTVSEFSRQSLAAHGIGHPDKIDVIYNGTDHLMRVPADRGVLRRHGLAPGGYVLALGSAKGYKNMRVLFDAWRDAGATLPRLVIAGGPGADAYAARGWQPPAGTLFTGFVSDGELRALYEGAVCFAFPSLTEGFGLPPVEAMWCDTPVVAARAGAMPEVCAAAALYAPASEPAAWRETIRRLCGDAALRREMSARGRARAAQLTWARAGERLRELILQVA
ncbi:glycosyltransferase involved in cell wall biosynthesis [Limimaricola variabilis]|uniref:Glycosyltransferase involved in cell wall biosynthesis n=1 Tax=Limimaricola variabilis TaxID=1492771 RepID=A0ABR6HMT8_9RHOB|nr:glycosyltransferase family 1 protein [Limimaricola variabilis]MBB3711876.1 glycosyltransferase involved in cell wall biosynthesis [Limimaricola variabilis]